MNWNKSWQMLLLIILFFMQSLSAQGIRKKIEKGNENYAKEQFEQALTDYKDALLDDPLNETALFNQGDALYKLKKYEEAVEAYQKDVSSEDLDLCSKAFYNIGNTYFQMDKLQESIQSYIKSLELNPNDTDAKYNLELARAKLKENADKQQQQKKNDNQDKKQEKIDPSEFAKKLKREADRLVKLRRYADAYSLLENGMKQDQTVKAYQDFISRLQEITGIGGKG